MAAGGALLVAGPGVLGGGVGDRWRAGGGRVVAQTATAERHGALRARGFEPRTARPGGGGSGGGAGAAERSFPNVIFSAPPSGAARAGFADYPAAVEEAAGQWDGTGTLLFTGSASVYAADGAAAVSERSETKLGGADDEKTDRLLRAEEAVLARGGCVVRLVGLYHSQRGAHTFFLKKQEVPRWGGYTINLLHYEDAAELCFRILQGGRSGAPFREEIFLGCDGAPITLEDMMAATLASGAYGEGRCSLTGAPGGGQPLGKLNVDCSWTREQTGWSPEHGRGSYVEFMANGARDSFSAP